MGASPDRTQLEPIETASIDELRSLQTERLRTTVQRAYANVAHYRQAWDAAGVHPDDIREQFQLPPRDKSIKPRQEPRSTQEAIANAVSRDPEPVSAFASAFQQALERFDASNNSETAATVSQALGHDEAEGETEASAPEASETEGSTEETSAPQAANTEEGTSDGTPDAPDAQEASAPGES